MASIIQIRGKWRAQIRLANHPKQTRTFATKGAAEAWAKDTETRLLRGEAAPATPTVSEIIQWYRELRDKGRPILDTANEHYMLKLLDRHLGPERWVDLTPERLAQWATVRKEDGAGPYTVNMEFSKLGTVARLVGPAKRVVLPDVVGMARPLLIHNRLIGGGGKRERRPTEDEMVRVLQAMREDYRDALLFAAITGLRRGELVAIRWADVDAARRLVRVDRKHPRLGKVSENVPILGDAWTILERQPRTDERIFPIHPQTLSKTWTETVRSLSIPDLQLRDLRHEGISRMFEAGYDIPQVALVSGHKKWETLKRYTQLKPEHLVEADRGIRKRPSRLRTASRRPRKSASQTPHD